MISKITIWTLDLVLVCLEFSLIGFAVCEYLHLPN